MDKLFQQNFTPKVLQDWDQYSAKMATFHESYDLLLTPTVADVAPTLEQFIPTDQMVNRHCIRKNYQCRNNNS